MRQSSKEWLRVVVFSLTVIAIGVAAIWLTVRNHRADATSAAPTVTSGAVTTIPRVNAQPDATAVAATWVGRWLAGRTAASQQEWLAGLGDYTTTRFHRLLEHTDRSGLPTTEVVISITGHPAPRHAQLLVRLLDGTELKLTMERATSTAPWLVSDIRPA